MVLLIFVRASDSKFHSRNALKMVYKSVNNQPPIYLTEMIVRLSDACKRELRNTEIALAIPGRKSAFGQKCFSYKGAKSWNDLSVEVKSSNSYEIFKKTYQQC